MAIRYTINDSKNFEIEVFKDNNEKPFLRQSAWPNREPFASHNDADSWARAYVASIEDKTAPYAPLGPGLTGKAKPTDAQLKAIKDAQDALKAARDAIKG